MSGGWKIEKDLCRCCHAEGSFHHLTQPFFNLGQPEVYADMLHQTLNIDITQVTGVLCEMTYTICENCVLRLRDATNFKRQVLLCEDRFKDMYRDVMKALSPTFEVKQEISITLENVKEEVAQNEDDDTEESIHLRFDDDDDEDDVEMEVKLDELKKDKDRNKPPKAKPKPKPKPRAVKKPVKAMTSKEGTSEAGKKTEMKPQKGNYLQFLITSDEDGTENYTCQLCRKQFKDRRNFGQHYKYVHLRMKPKVRTCHICKLKIAPYKRAAHMEEAHGVPAPTCGICNKKFSYPNQLLRHQKIVHMGEKEYECELCHIKFATLSKLTLHQAKHTGIRPFICEYCNKGFKWQKNLKTHIMMHLNDKRQVCHICQEAFVQYSSLKYHMGRRHPDRI